MSDWRPSAPTDGARITIRNVSDPDPPAVTRFLFGTHPSIVERLGIGEAYRRTR